MAGVRIKVDHRDDGVRGYRPERAERFGAAARYLFGASKPSVGNDVLAGGWVDPNAA